MKFLDQLEQKAKAQREEEERAQMLLDEQRAFFREVVRPTAQELFENLKRLCEHLNYLGDRAEMDYSVPGYGKVRGRLGNDMKTLFQGQEEQLKITVVGSVHFPIQRPVEMFGPDINRMREFIRGGSLRGNERLRKDDKGRVVGAIFRVEGQITLRAEIATSLERPELAMTFINFDDFGSRRRILEPEELNEDMMDSLAQLIAGVDASFIREQLSDEERKEIRAQVELERQARMNAKASKRQEREEDTRRKQAEIENRERAEAAERLSGRFRSRLEEAKRRIDKD